MLTGTLPPQTNAETFDVRVEFLDKDTREPIDLTDLSIVFAMTPEGTRSPTIVASSESGEITVIDLGVAQVLIPRARMNVCAPSNYKFGLTVKVDDDDVCSPVIGTISILDGVVLTP